MDSESVSREMLQRMLVAAPHSTLTKALLQPARQALQKINRRGFKSRDIQQTAVLDGFAAGWQPLLALRQQLQDYLHTLDRHTAARD